MNIIKCLVSNYSFTDSLADTLKTIFYSEAGKKYTEVLLKGRSGIRTTHDSNGVRSASLFPREIIKASFPGGQPSLDKYLQVNLDPNVPFRNAAPVGSYQVIVDFIVSKEGEISGVKAETNYGFGMEEELSGSSKRAPQG